MKTRIALTRIRQYQYIYIYYKQENQTIRINTKIQAKKSELTKEGYFKRAADNSLENNARIALIREKVEEYIKEQIKSSKPLNQAECYNYLETASQKSKEKPVNPTPAPEPDKINFLTYYDKFVREREREINFTYGTGKMYSNLKTALLEYEKHLNALRKPFTFDYFNDKSTIIEFKGLLATERKLCDNTIAKRLITLRTYLRWIEEGNIFQFNSTIYRVRQNKYQKEIIALSRAELEQIINIKTTNEAWQRVIDVFVCNCFLGLRVSDLMTLDRGEFKKDNDGDFYYIKENIKTGITVNIPITEIPLRILQKYNFSLPTYASQYFNRELQKILKHYKLFEYPVTHIRKVQKESHNSTVLMREVITSHTCRKTFITLAVSNNIPLNVIMKASGHRQINTLTSYVQLVADKNEFKKLCS